MVDAQVWTLIGLLATALFTLLVQLRSGERTLGDRMGAMEQRIADLSLEMHRGFGDIRGDIAVLRSQINRDGQ